MINFEKREAAINPEGKYGSLFARLESFDIIPKIERPLDLERLKRRLDEAFREHGRKSIEKNDGKIFMTLSGGLDSTLCLAFLRKNFPESEIATFTIGGSRNHPDVVHSRIAAEKFGTDHNEFIPAAEEIGDVLEEYREKLLKDPEKGTETGDVDTFLLLKYISRFNPKALISHDGIDELMGGYPEHRWAVNNEEKKKNFEECWKKLVPDHLKPLTETGDIFNIEILLPYLDEKVMDEISGISLEDRTSEEISKKPLRRLAEEMGVPEEIIKRKKEGRVGALKREI